MITPDVVREIDPERYERKFVEAGIRSDGRVLKGVSRPAVVVPDVISTAVGSASCKIGNTAVVAGVTAGVFVQPEGIVAACPDGQVSVVIDLSLIQFERRVAQQEGGALARRIEVVLGNREVLDRSQLLVSADENKDKAVWDLNVSVVVLCDDGALMDCVMLAVVAALKNTKLPSLDKDLKIVRSDPQRPVVIGAVPVGLSFALYSSADKQTQYLIDPTKGEERVFPKLTIVTIGDDILSIQGPEIPGIVKATASLDLDVIASNVWPLIVAESHKRRSLLE